jgi:sterol desaturase/sphingolipid hydroxylase (fatty acid hydroxylase superfamily)
MLKAALTLVLGMAITMAMFVPLERLFPARKTQSVLRREWVLDLCFYLGQQLVWGGLSVTALLTLRSWMGDDAMGLLGARFRTLPWLLQAAVVLVLGDLLVYVWHRACHRVPLLWRFHAVHHSSESLDWIAAFREHPLDGLTTQLMQNLPAFLLGFPLLTLAGLATFRGAWAIFVHSNTRLRIGPLAMLLGAPELHHFHHARVAETRHYFANVAPWIDWLFGTYHRPEDEPEALGLVDSKPSGYFRHLVEPFLTGAKRRSSG